MTRADHYREAERLLEMADRPNNHPDASRHYLRMAQVHATLANASALYATLPNASAHYHKEVE